MWWFILRQTSATLPAMLKQDEKSYFAALKCQKPLYPNQESDNAWL